jgi:succinate dehydrogenase/fumarate reductase iron-sulfur protein
LTKRKENGVALTVLRYDTRKASEPYYETFNVKATKDTTILDALFQVLETQDYSLAFRYSCRSAVCGSCAMFINGRHRLACLSTAHDEEKGR